MFKTILILCIFLLSSCNQKSISTDEARLVTLNLFNVSGKGGAYVKIVNSNTVLEFQDSHAIHELRSVLEKGYRNSSDPVISQKGWQRDEVGYFYVKTENEDLKSKLYKVKDVNDLFCLRVDDPSGKATLIYFYIGFGEQWKR